MSDTKSGTYDIKVGSLRYFSRVLTDDEIYQLYKDEAVSDPKQDLMDLYFGGINYQDAVDLLKENFPENFI